MSIRESGGLLLRIAPASVSMKSVTAPSPLLSPMPLLQTRTIFSQLAGRLMQRQPGRRSTTQERPIGQFLVDAAATPVLVSTREAERSRGLSKSRFIKNLFTLVLRLFRGWILCFRCINWRTSIFLFALCFQVYPVYLHIVYIHLLRLWELALTSVAVGDLRRNARW